MIHLQCLGAAKEAAAVETPERGVLQSARAGLLDFGERHARFVALVTLFDRLVLAASVSPTTPPPPSTAHLLAPLRERGRSHQHLLIPIQHALSRCVDCTPETLSTITQLMRRGFRELVGAHASDEHSPETLAAFHDAVLKALGRVYTSLHNELTRYISFIGTTSSSVRHSELTKCIRTALLEPTTGDEPSGHAACRDLLLTVSNSGIEWLIDVLLGKISHGAYSSDEWSAAQNERLLTRFETHLTPASLLTPGTLWTNYLELFQTIKHIITVEHWYILLKIPEHADTECATLIVSRAARAKECVRSYSSESLRGGEVDFLSVAPVVLPHLTGRDLLCALLLMAQILTDVRGSRILTDNTPLTDSLLRALQELNSPLRRTIRVPGMHSIVHGLQEALRKNASERAAGDYKDLRDACVPALAPFLAQANDVELLLVLRLWERNNVAAADPRLLAALTTAYALSDSKESRDTIKLFLEYTVERGRDAAGALLSILDRDNLRVASTFRALLISVATKQPLQDAHLAIASEYTQLSPAVLKQLYLFFVNDDLLHTAITSYLNGTPRSNDEMNIGGLLCSWAVALQSCTAPRTVITTLFGSTANFDLAWAEVLPLLERRLASIEREIEMVRRWDPAYRYVPIRKTRLENNGSAHITCAWIVSPVTAWFDGLSDVARFGVVAKILREEGAVPQEVIEAVACITARVQSVMIAGGELGYPTGRFTIRTFHRALEHYVAQQLAQGEDVSLPPQNHGHLDAPSFLLQWKPFARIVAHLESARETVPTFTALCRFLVAWPVPEAFSALREKVSSDPAPWPEWPYKSQWLLSVVCATSESAVLTKENFQLVLSIAAQCVPALRQSYIAGVDTGALVEERLIDGLCIFLAPQRMRSARNRALVNELAQSGVHTASALLAASALAIFVPGGSTTRRRQHKRLYPMLEACLATAPHCARPDEIITKARTITAQCGISPDVSDELTLRFIPHGLSTVERWKKVAAHAFAQQSKGAVALETLLTDLAPFMQEFGPIAAIKLFNLYVHLRSGRSVTIGTTVSGEHARLIGIDRTGKEGLEQLRGVRLALYNRLFIDHGSTPINSEIEYELLASIVRFYDAEFQGFTSIQDKVGRFNERAASLAKPPACFSPETLQVRTRVRTSAVKLSEDTQRSLEKVRRIFSAYLSTTESPWKHFIDRATKYLEKKSLRDTPARAHLADRLDALSTQIKRSTNVADLLPAIHAAGLPRKMAATILREALIAELTAQDEMKGIIERHLAPAGHHDYETALSGVIELLGHQIFEKVVKPLQLSRDDRALIRRATASKALQQALGQAARGAFEQHVAHGVTTKEIITAFPSRGLIGEFSGECGDTCWALQQDLLLEQFPHFVPIIFVKNFGTAIPRVVGACIIIPTISTDEAGVSRSCLLIRGLNPLESLLSEVDVGSFFEEFINYLEKVARKGGYQEIVGIADSVSNEAQTNRPRLFAYQSNAYQDAPKRFVPAEETTFNHYDVSNGCVLLRTVAQ